MGLFNTIRMGASGAGDAYEISRSLRFDNDDSPRLNFTASSAGNRQKWTKSFWLKRGSISRQFITAYYISGADVAAIELGDQHTVHFYDYYNGYRMHLETNQKFRDPTAWMHFVFNIDTTQSTASERAKIYLNGERITSFNIETYPSQNLNISFNQNVLEAWGTEGAQQRLHFDGYLAEIYNIDGQQLDPTNFGKTDPVTNQWVPIEYTGTFGQNGYHLDFSDNTNNSAIGTDRSGNGNNWTPVNIASSHDVVLDTPTNNFCTLNSIADAGATYGSGTIGNANLRYTGGSSNRTVASTFGISPSDTKGYYFESKIISGNQANRLFVGIGYTSTNWVSTDARGANSDSWVLRNGDGVFIHNSGTDGETTGAGALSVGDIIQIAVKGSNIWVGKNNSWLFSGDPANNSTPKFNDVNETWTPVADVMTSNVINFNFGQDSTFGTGSGYQGNTDANGHGDFYYTPPSGFFAICSANLPTPSIAKPELHFNCVTWTGNTTSPRNITGVGFDPSIVSIKARTNTYEFLWFDAIRGAGKRIFSHNNNAESDNLSTLSAFITDGFTVGQGSGVDLSVNGSASSTYVAWNWNSGSSTVTNNDGSTTTQVRANTTAGISAVTYSGPGSESTATIGHGLGVTPQAAIFKRRDSSGNWMVYHQGIGNTHNLYFNTSDSKQDDSHAFNDTSPTSSVFTLGISGFLNASSGTYVGYLFSEVEGFSKFGTYTGNGNSSGAFVFTGFRPAYVLVKGEDFAGNWNLFDNERPGFNVTNDRLFPNLSDAETDGSPSNNQIDIVSNGFKMRGSNVDTNSNGSTYVYLAFAEAPFKYSRAT